MDRKRILVMNNGGLSGAGLVSILSSNEALEVEMATASDQEVFLQVIADHQPDILILDKTTLIAILEPLASLLKDLPSQRTVIVSWDENEIEVCERRQILIASIDDFLKAL